MSDHQCPQFVSIKPLVSVLALVVLLVAATSEAFTQGSQGSQGTQSAQGAAKDAGSVASLIATGQQQLQQARTAKTQEAYELAVATFDRAVQLDGKDAMARLSLGLARMELSGWLAQQGRFGPSGEMTSKATADMDAAVALAPENLQVRLARGSSYSWFPSFLNKSAVAREDLEVVVHHPTFAAQNKDLRARAHYTLGRVYAVQGEAEKARASWQAAVDASPQSNEGKAAQLELAKLAAPGVANDSAGRRMPDRFPRITPDTSPIIVAATVTFPDHQGDWRRESLPASMKTFLDQLEKQPGLLGVHALSSLDHRGMLVILTWWEDKKALNDWFYSETHQGIIKQFYGSGQPAPGPVGSQTASGAMGQVGIELFTPLPGGMAFGGGLTPAKRAKQ